ncbi:hypothetical protein GF362_04865 [Candidatus Dojkabacteria bacterium]|nr:hypothetical protein [Candidatus Dojkabacteria bacterium]
MEQELVHITQLTTNNIWQALNTPLGPCKVMPLVPDTQIGPGENQVQDFEVGCVDDRRNQHDCGNCPLLNLPPLSGVLKSRLANWGEGIQLTRITSD